MTAPVVILADDDETIRAVLTQAFSRANYVVRATGNAATLWRWVAEGQGDLVVSDVVLPDENVFEILPRMKKARPGLPIIVMSAKNTIMTAITAAERGAYDYLPKPFDLNELLGLAAKAIEHSQRPANANANSGATPAHPAESLPIIGRSPAMQDIFRIIARMTQTDLTVMISGESGTGKELVAKALHDFGRRRKGPFVAVNMAAIPRELIESELFGHEKGAFTGAAQRFAGRFEQAQGGTLFLDEIGDMPMEAQTRLLRVLQEGEYTTVGGRTALKADVRIIAATHRELRQLIGQGSFREDLYYRLNVVPVRLPPLRERPDDIEDLTSHFLAACEAEGLARKRLTRDALERLRRYRWPGNVRELENLVRRIAAIYVDETITAEIIERELENGTPPIGEAEGLESLDTLALSEFTARFLERQFAGCAPGLPPTGLYQRTLREVEVPLITAALAATGANQLRAAELLGINRNTLRARIRELGLQVVRSSL
jgi:two-component system, NtrC family, nitrogen regulation response regulator GlnG